MSESASRAVRTSSSGSEPVKRWAVHLTTAALLAAAAGAIFVSRGLDLAAQLIAAGVVVAPAINHARWGRCRWLVAWDAHGLSVRDDRPASWSAVRTVRVVRRAQAQQLLIATADRRWYVPLRYATRPRSELVDDLRAAWDGSRRLPDPADRVSAPADDAAC